MTACQYFPENTAGRDFVVGDIHGEFDMLVRALLTVRFQSKTDRLFSVGDLIDRGPLSHQAVYYLVQPWFHAVRGNHEDMMLWAMDDLRCGAFNSQACQMYRMNGGGWLFGQSAATQDTLYDVINTLPYSITVGLEPLNKARPNKRVGIVHAEPCFHDWSEHEVMLNDHKHARVARNIATWSRDRFMNHDDKPAIAGVEHVFVGHCPGPDVRRHENVINIDTHAYNPRGTLTLCHLATGEIAAQITKD